VNKNNYTFSSDSESGNDSGDVDAKLEEIKNGIIEAGGAGA